MVLNSRSSLLPRVLAATVALVAALAVSQAFVQPPRLQAPAAALAGAHAALFGPMLALAELPPLEDLPLDQLTVTKPYSKPEAVYGVTFPMALVGLLCAVIWAGFWVSSLKPKKDEEGVYKTYIGAGDVPPLGYTNPLDPRMSEEYAIDDETPKLKEQKGKKAAGSAIV
eukprot:CAMPEP_0172790474 /NCGR_PEP_ID=MMETSP1074-20121228/207985_1 /TAXON_ID=2916 /ORGANISM="Ceratium fusus, Strain PA161109" /LENGTH=168 /DNA_ID=CAMNT_0013627523 /DNA_START=38 /DNA_END=544 /DNA_ORIENTATION=-